MSIGFHKSAFLLDASRLLYAFFSIPCFKKRKWLVLHDVMPIKRLRERLSTHLLIYFFLFFKLSLGLGLDFDFELKLTLE